MRAVSRTCPAASELDARLVERRAIEAVLDGDHVAFTTLVERHYPRVRAMMLRLVSNGADADDLAQSAFVAAFVALDEFDLELRFSTWLYRIAINLAKDHLKSKKRGESALGSDEVCEAAFAGRITSADEATLARERCELVDRALATLCVEDRELIVLKDVEELPFAEIRARTGRPVTALKIRAVRARTRLRQALVKLAPRDIV